MDDFLARHRAHTFAVRAVVLLAVTAVAGGVTAVASSRDAGSRSVRAVPALDPEPPPAAETPTPTPTSTPSPTASPTSDPEPTATPTVAGPPAETAPPPTATATRRPTAA